MRILWIVNTPIYIDKAHATSIRGGWMEGALRSLAGDTEICIAFISNVNKKHEKIGRIEYYYFHYDQFNIKFTGIELEKELESIIKDSQPDIIHIWGTEYLHSYAAVQAANNLGMITKVVVNLQGIVSVYARHCFIGLPIKYQIKKGFRDKTIYDKRGKYEKEVIESIEHVIGRTDWDKACVLMINPKVHYYSCNEILRPLFYSGDKWDAKKCLKHSLFVTQPWHPIKGFHYILEAGAILKKKYPDIKIYATGDNMFHRRNRRNEYVQYLYGLIKKYDLYDNVNFVGELNETQMKAQFLKAHVFISASTIENESNAISEARILGVPVVASYVGGVTGRITHGEDGFLYPFDEPYMLAYYVDKIFNDKNLAEYLSENEIVQANIINDIETNKNRLLSIYSMINGDR